VSILVLLASAGRKQAVAIVSYLAMIGCDT